MRLPYSAAAAAALISCAAARAGAGSCACPSLLRAAFPDPRLPHFQKWDLCSNLPGCWHQRRDLILKVIFSESI